MADRVINLRIGILWSTRSSQTKPIQMCLCLILDSLMILKLLFYPNHLNPPKQRNGRIQFWYVARYVILKLTIAENCLDKASRMDYLSSNLRGRVVAA